MPNLAVHRPTGALSDTMETKPRGDSGAGEGRQFDRTPVARILVSAGAQIASRGTGTLVAPRLVLSALHVVANRRSDPPQPYPGEITLEFPGFTTKGSILPGAMDRTADWVLIECAEAPPVTPMALAALQENAREWESFGFPDANARDGLLLTGNVLMYDGRLEDTPAHQLYCPQAAAGSGGRVKGMSGAPVVIDGRLVGVMRFALMEQDRTEMGTLYACPVKAVAERWPTLDIPPLPKLPRKSLTDQILAANILHAGWELAAIAGSLLIIAAGIFSLSQVHVRTTRVDGTVFAEDVQFRLPKPAPVRLTVNGGLLSVASLDATGLESIGVPGSGGRRASVPARSGHFSPTATTGSPGQLGLDMSPAFPAGARLWLHASQPTRYRLEVDSVQTPLRAGFNGTVRAGPDESNLRSYTSATGDSLLLVPLNGTTFKVEMSLHAGTEVLLSLDKPFAVENLGFYSSEYPDFGPPARVPTLARGELRIDGPDGAVVVGLKLRDSIAFVSDDMTVKGLRFPADANGAVEVTFFGTVSGLTVGGDGVVANLMPTWLDRIRHRYALPAAAVTAALAAFLAFLIVRWRRKSA